MIILIKNINLKSMTSWELIDLMLHYLDKGYIDNAKYVQDEILSRTYCTDPTMN